MRLAAAVIGAAALILSSAAQAQQTEPGGPEVWDMSDAAAPRHWFTGLRCPPETIGLPLSRHMAFDASGADVGCFYQHGQSDDYVTVYATKRYPFDAPLQTIVELADVSRPVVMLEGQERVLGQRESASACMAR